MFFVKVILYWSPFFTTLLQKVLKKTSMLFVVLAFIPAVIGSYVAYQDYKQDNNRDENSSQLSQKYRQLNDQYNQLSTETQAIRSFAEARYPTLSAKEALVRIPDEFKEMQKKYELLSRDVNNIKTGPIDASKVKGTLKDVAIDGGTWK